MAEYISKSEQETEAIARSFALGLKKGSIVAFSGGMGMGKTVFTRGIAQGLGITDDVFSPTFSIVNSYVSDDITLHHFDLFRIETYGDLYSTGFFDYLDGNSIVVIEWSENISGLDLGKVIRISIERIDNNTRKIIIEE